MEAAPSLSSGTNRIQGIDPCQHLFPSKASVAKYRMSLSRHLGYRLQPRAWPWDLGFWRLKRRPSSLWARLWLRQTFGGEDEWQAEGSHRRKWISVCSNLDRTQAGGFLREFVN